MLVIDLIDENASSESKKSQPTSIPVATVSSVVVVAPVEDSDDPSEVLRGEALVVERVRHVPGGGEGQDGRLHAALHRLGRTVQVQTETENVG